MEVKDGFNRGNSWRFLGLSIRGHSAYFDVDTNSLSA